MCVSSTLLVALTGLVASTTATDSAPPSTEVADEDRRLLKNGDAEPEERKSTSKIFEKLGFCNTKTLRGRYTFFSNGNANLSPVFARGPGETVDPAGPVGPLATSGFTFYDGKGVSFTELAVRPDMGPGALGPLAVIDIWSNYEVLKNCSNLLQASVARFRPTAVSPALIIPATTLFLEGNVAPAGSDNVFTLFDTTRVVAFSGDQKQVAKFAVPPPGYDNPPPLPGCLAPQSCVRKYEGEPCDDDGDCRTFCFPTCGMTCVNPGILQPKVCKVVI